MLLKNNNIINLNITRIFPPLKITATSTSQPWSSFTASARSSCASSSQYLLLLLLLVAPHRHHRTQQGTETLRGLSRQRLLAVLTTPLTHITMRPFQIALSSSISPHKMTLFPMIENQTLCNRVVSRSSYVKILHDISCWNSVPISHFTQVRTFEYLLKRERQNLAWHIRGL